MVGLHRFTASPRGPKGPELGSLVHGRGPVPFSLARVHQGPSLLLRREPGWVWAVALEPLEREKPSHFREGQLGGATCSPDKLLGCLPAKALQCTAVGPRSCPPPPQAAEVGGGNSGKGAVGHHGAGFKTEPGPPGAVKGWGDAVSSGLSLPLVKRRAGSGRPGDGQLAPRALDGDGSPAGRPTAGGPRARRGGRRGRWAEARLAVGLPAWGSGAEDPARRRPAPPASAGPSAARASRGRRPAVLRARRRRARPRAPAAVGRRASERACVRARAAAPGGAGA